MGTENKESCSQRDSAERKGYVRAHRSFNRIWKERDSAEPLQESEGEQRSAGSGWHDHRSGTAMAEGT